MVLFMCTVSPLFTSSLVFSHKYLYIFLIFTNISIHVSNFVHQVLGDEAGGLVDSTLGNLVMGMHTRFDKMPLTTQLLVQDEAGTETGNIIAARLARKFEVQAFVSCNIDVARYEGDPDPDEAGPSLVHGISENLFKILGPHYS